MKNKIYEFIMLILYWVLYGIAICCIIFNGLQTSIEIVWFICISILVIARTFTATITLLTKDINYIRSYLQDSVMISREEYEQHANEYKNLSIKYDQVSDKYRLCKDANERLKQKAISASKETAEKIYTFVNSFGINNWERFKEFIKQFGVEIKE